MAKWDVSVGQAAQADQQPVVAEYKAVIKHGLERSEVTINGAIDRETVIRAAAAEPAWSSEPWVPPRDDSDGEVLRCFISKLNALFAFGEKIPGDDSASMRASLREKYSSVSGGAFGDTPQDDGPRRYKWIEVGAQMRGDGTCTWWYDVPGLGDYPDFLTSTQGTINVLAEGTLDDFLQSTVHLDLVERRESLSGAH